jgi:hypothetical protein
MIRSSSRSSLSLWAAFILVSSGACATRDGAGRGFSSTSEFAEAPRQPDGVVVDPSPELPAAVDESAAKSVSEQAGSRRGAAVPPLVALKPPLPDKLARMVVADFFRAVVTKDPDEVASEIARLSTTDATTPVRARGGALGLQDIWRTRVRQFRYRTLANEVLYQESDIELYRYDDLETPLPGRPFRPPEMNRTDVLLKVPLLVVRAGNDRVFGDEIQFLLRRDKGRYRIRQLIEDFQLP